MKQPLILSAALVLCAALVAGCGGTSGSGGGRSLSGVVSEEEEKKESRTRGDDSRSRTRTDHQQNDTYEYESYSDSSSDDDDSGGILWWVVSALFSGGDDEEEYEEPMTYQEYVPTDPYVENEIGGEGTDKDKESEERSDLSIGRFSVGYRQSWSHLAGDAIDGFRTGMVTAGIGPKDRTKLYLGVYFGSGDFERSDASSSTCGASSDSVDSAVD